MAAVRGGMGDNSSAVPGEGKILGINKPKACGGQHSKDGKDPLECGLGIIGGRLPSHDVIYDVLSGNGAGIFGLSQFPVRANKFLWLFAVFAGRKKGRGGISIPWSQPETVHKVVVRAEGREVIGAGAADEDSEGNGRGKDFLHP